MPNKQVQHCSPRLARMNIYVGNLSLVVTEGQLRQAFSVFGQVASVRILNDKYIGSNQPWGYAFVEMAVRLEGEAAIRALDGSMFNDRAVSLIEALPLSPVIVPHLHGRRIRQRC